MKQLITLFFLFCLQTTAFAASQQTALMDFHRTLHLHPITQQAEQIELYTKQEDANVFLGIICTDNSAFPVIQVMLFDDQVITDSIQYMDVALKRSQDNSQQKLKGLLKAEESFEEISNKVRFDLASDKGSNFRSFQEKYLSLLDWLSDSKQVSIELSHRKTGTQQYQFSMQGLKQLIQPYKNLCQ